MMEENKRHIILFDGVCNLCNGAINFIIDRDVHDTFAFAALQSAAGQQLLAKHQFSGNSLDSLVLIEKGKIYQRSTAALRIARRLRFPWPLWYIFILVPPFMRNGAYHLLAKYRYKIFGKSAACRYPSEDIKAKFIF